MRKDVHQCLGITAEINEFPAFHSTLRRELQARDGHIRRLLRLVQSSGKDVGKRYQKKEAEMAGLDDNPMDVEKNVEPKMHG